jgi:hypothetical protein
VHRALSKCLFALLLAALSAHAAEQKVIKVLPHLLDKKGRHAVSPSLFDRDAYQAWLRRNPDEQSGIRYDVQWRSREAGEFKLKLELIGRVEKGVIRRRTIEKEVTLKHPKSLWSGLALTGRDFKEFGPIVAWRVSVWRGDKMVARQQSFLWE